MSLRVDAHLHVWVQQPDRYPWQPTLGYIPTSHAPVEEFVALMDRYGLDYAVLVQPSPYGWDNSYLVDSLKKYPDRLVGVCLVDPLSPEAPERLRYWVTVHGVRGLRLNPIGDPEGRWLNAPTQDPLWATAAELGIPICIQLLPHQAPMVADMARRHPGVAVVIDHFGRPRLDDGPDYPHYQAVLALAGYPNVFLKFSGLHHLSREGYPYRDTYPLVERAFRAFGARRMLWGSDYPGILRAEYPGLAGRQGITYEQALRLLPDHIPFLTADDLDWIMGETAAHLWGLGGRPRWRG
jgi:predicted TIM-barrel fold metal-dependent hydrolase